MAPRLRVMESLQARKTLERDAGGESDLLLSYRPGSSFARVYGRGAARYAQVHSIVICMIDQQMREIGLMCIDVSHLREGPRLCFTVRIKMSLFCHLARLRSTCYSSLYNTLPLFTA